MKKEIIKPIATELLVQELTKDKFLRPVNKGANEIYVITHNDSPNVMREVGRLRELTFRTEGGGTGEEVDIDEYDISRFKQLVLWNPKTLEIVGGYRYACMRDLWDGEILLSPASNSFTYAPKFIEEYVPYSLELGRSFVQPKYQPKRNGGKEGVFSLDNLWDGLGTLVVNYPEMKYLFGKVTMYPSFDPYVRNFILFFLRKHFADKDNMMSPIHKLKDLENNMMHLEMLSKYVSGVKGDDSLIFKVLDVFNDGFKPIIEKYNREKVEAQLKIFSQMFGDNTYEEDINLLIKMVRIFGEDVPPLVKQYMDMSPTMKVFGTGISRNFGDVEETGILVTIADLHGKKADRHIESYRKYLADNA